MHRIDQYLASNPTIKTCTIMARKGTSSDFKIRKLDLKEAQREFNRRRGRGSKYDDILDAAEKLEKGKALIVGQITYSEVTGIRQRIKEYLSDEWSISATKVDRDNNLYDVLIHRD